MKKILLFYMALFISNTQQAQVRLPSPSPAQSIKQEFGLGNIEVSYTRPGAKGRRVFGDLVAYGKLWNTSANSPAKLYFSEPVEIVGNMSYTPSPEKKIGISSSTKELATKA